MFINQSEQLALDSLFFSRQLETLLPGILERRVLPKNAVRLFPSLAVPDPDMERITKRAISFTGETTRGRIGEGSGSTRVANAQTTEETYKLRHYKFGWEVTARELRLAQKMGLPLDSSMGNYVLERLETRENDTLLNGDTTFGLNGLWSAGLIGTTALGSGATWDVATSANIYADLEQMVKYIMETSNTAYQEPVTIVLPVQAYNIANGKQFAAGTDTTVLQYFLRNWGAFVADIEMAREFDAQKEALVYIRNPEFMGHFRTSMRTIGPIYNRAEEIWTADFEIGTSGMVVFDTNAQRRFTGILP